MVVTTGGLLASVGGPRDAAQRPSAQHTPETPGPVSPVPRGRDFALRGAEAVGLSGFGVAVLAICGALGLQPRPRVLPRSLAVSRAPAGSSASGRIRAGAAGNQETGDSTPARRHLAEVGHRGHMELGSPPGEACGVTLLGTPSDPLLAPVWSLSLATAPVSVSPGPSGRRF